MTEGEPIEFYQKTTTIPAQLVKKYGCDIVPVYIERKINTILKYPSKSQLNLIIIPLLKK